MTAGTGIPGLKADETPRCTDPAELRRRARDARGRRALFTLQAMNLDREADQLEHEAALWEVADSAENAVNALHDRTPGLEAAAEGTLAARRAAEDKLRDDRKHVARRKGEVTRAEHGTNREVQDEAAVRLHSSEQRLAETERELAAAAREHQDAETALEAHRAALREAHAAWTRALEAGFSPGTARSSGQVHLTLGDPAALTPAEKTLLTPYAHEVLKPGPGQAAGAAPPSRERRTTNAGFAAQDPSRFRMIRQGDSMIAVPPAIMPSQGR